MLAGGIALVFVWLVGMACRGFLPDPTSRSVAVADLAGTYTYSYAGSEVLVHLLADGTFEIANSATYSGTGTWSLDGATLTFEFDAGGTMSGWYVVDGVEGSFDILGGESDPDTWGTLKKLE